MDKDRKTIVENLHYILPGEDNERNEIEKIFVFNKQTLAIQRKTVQKKTNRSGLGYGMFRNLKKAGSKYDSGSERSFAKLFYVCWCDRAAGKHIGKNI